MAGPLLVLGLIALCGQTALWCGVHGAQTSRISKYETVIPERRHLKQKRQVEPRDKTIQDHWEDNLSYSINAAERTYLLMLKKNTALLSNQFTLSRYTKDGQLEYSPQQKEIHCYYHGHVEGVEKSMVALSLCHGLRGVIHIGDQGYGIEPMEKSTLGEHLLYKLEDVQKEPTVCGVIHSDDGWQQDTVTSFFQEINSSYTGFNRQHLYRRKRDVLPVTSIVELSIMVDNYRYKIKGSDQAAVKKDVFELVNTVGAMYVPLNIQIVLIELNIWIDVNPFDVMSGTAGDVLGRFSNWRGTATGLKRSDASHLLIGRGSYNGVLGMAYVGTVCSPTIGSSISAFSNGSTPVIQATIVAHEIGHNLGMSHDDGRCGSSYIMYSTDMGAKTFSTCSSQDFQNLILQNKGNCLKNAPKPSDVLTEPVCGNNIVDSGEQCDCGSVQECKNPCCQAATCTLTSGSQCAYGLCCDNCKFRGSGTECRPQADSCDLAEYCNGSHPLCPEDFYVMDGYPCNNSQTYCYEGRCQTLDAQCKALFKEGATRASDTCFQVVNLFGDKYGNCGVSGEIYKKCASTDALCGKLQCTGTIVQPPNSSVSQYNNNNVYTCTAIDFNLGTDVPDPGMVHRGTGCGDGKACVDYACVNSSKLGYDCNVAAKCNDHGVCNNNGNCHCNYGWAPPSCAGSGCGGSIDSGPSPCDNRLRDAMLIVFLLVVPVLILVIIFFKRNAIKGMIRRRKQRYRENNNSTTVQTRPPKPNQNQQRNEDGNSNIMVDDVFTISRFTSPRPPVTPAVPPRPPPPQLDFLHKPPVPPRPQGFQNV
ncbi:disintegrin and metalloproteinase domain-containing protein 9-like [Lissotriton helveticus]